MSLFVLVQLASEYFCLLSLILLLLTFNLIVEFILSKSITKILFAVGQIMNTVLQHLQCVLPVTSDEG